ncbi:phosphatase PAP2 family protein [Sphingobacterium oryzagri]|uniref:Phosphatase PAP2 family protein n=1 Tax=Sphingobacterium oryzagri TaxID=3025669 RepID=A0ABY7WJH9_9SPHI|nr:phosphatase PAP2 family protein [Sphingobacterium sp. KACC 22765]WDF69753.1 phosphatase PAP2 family protein [Sphingobacterium sp. KACC 22765]
MTEKNEPLKRGNPFASCLFLWIILLSVASFCFPKLDSFAFINGHHHPIADIFFATITFAGDGYVIVGLGLTLYFMRHRTLGIALVASYISSGLLCSLLKRTFHAPRPVAFFADNPDFNAVSWMPMAYHNSFPSGHTTSVFAMVMTIALFSKNRTMAHIALLVGCLTAYSRVYLGQHFVEDLWLGTFLGCSVSLLCYRIYVAWPQRSANRIRVRIPSLNV